MYQALSKSEMGETMTIKKNDFIGNLKTPIVGVCEMAVRLPKGNLLAVPHMNSRIVDQALRDHPHRRGVPEMASVENGRSIRVFPRADKRYRLRVVGTQYVEQ